MYEEKSFINLSILKIKGEFELIFNGNQALQVEGMLVFFGFPFIVDLSTENLVRSVKGILPILS